MVRTRRKSSYWVFAVLAASAILCVLATTSGAAAGDTTRVSVDSSGAQANGASSGADISSDGRFVAFSSNATNLVPDDTNGSFDVFVRDLRPAPDQTTTIERVSVGPAGVQADNGVSGTPTISADGRYVAFVSGSTNLVANDTNGKWDVFVHDRQTGANTRVNVSDSGAQANESGPAFPAPSISDDGRFVAFSSSASNLVPNDTINMDVFVHDRDKSDDGTMDEAGDTRTERVSQTAASSGFGGNGSAYGHSMSTNGRYVAFYDSSSDLVAGDTDRTDVFVRDRQAGTLQRIRVDCSFSLCATHILNPSSISDDGRYVAFQADATGVLTGNNNGVDSLDDAFVYDRQTRTAQRVSAGNGCDTGNGGVPTRFAISSDGRYLAFQSNATNLVAGDTNGSFDVFVRDLRPAPDQTTTIERVSVGPAGVQANGSSNSPSISSDGRYVAFGSGSTNLVAGDTNGFGDVFVYERGNVIQQPGDCIAPTTTANAITASGAVYTSGTWTNEDVKVNFSAQDNEGGSGVKEIRYAATGAQGIPETVYDPQNPPVINTEGTTTMSFFANDEAGNRESPAKTLTVEIDRSAPDTNITSGPTDPTNDTSPTISFGGSDSATAASSLQFSHKVVADGVAPDSVAWSEYSSVTSATLGATTGLSQGSYAFYVKAKDQAGNEDATPAEFSFAVDTAAPAAPSIVSPAEGSTLNVRSFTVSGTAEANSTVTLSEGTASSDTATADGTGDWSIGLAGVPDGPHTYRAKATDAAGNASGFSNARTVVVGTEIVDTVKPRVLETIPLAGATGVAAGANVQATFSEAMRATTLRSTTFTLDRSGAGGTTTRVAAAVSYDAATKKAVLDPNANLVRGARYVATVTSGAKDSAGNALDQNRTQAGDQPKTWSFTVRP